MLDTLTERLSRIVKTARGQARLTEANTRDMTREIRLALLEADVALPVARELTARVRAQALGQEVVGSLNPGQALVGVFERELAAVIGADLPESERSLRLNVQPPAVILLVGLQGAGKTTSAGKLAKWLRETRNKKVLTFSADVYRPAAAEQLRLVSEQAGVDHFPAAPGQSPTDIAVAALDWARRHLYDVVIADSAGRLAIDEEMMAEAAELSAALSPAETLFVVDAMLGQDAVNSAAAFAQRLTLTGIVLTKADGDSRGGAALSARWVTGRPIKFMGVGEKLDGWEPFDPQRMASRILGMGDIVALVRDVQKGVDVKQAEDLARKLRSGHRFDLEDFRVQLSQMRGMNMADVIDKLPAQLRAAAGQLSAGQAERGIARNEGIICAMTPAERRHPELIKASRKRRIAAGAGVPVQQVNRLLKQFEQARELLVRARGGGMARMARSLTGMAGAFGRFHR